MKIKVFNIYMQIEVFNSPNKPNKARSTIKVIRSMSWFDWEENQ